MEYQFFLFYFHNLLFFLSSSYNYIALLFGFLIIYFEIFFFLGLAVFLSPYTKKIRKEWLMPIQLTAILASFFYLYLSVVLFATYCCSRLFVLPKDSKKRYEKVAKLTFFMSILIFFCFQFFAGFSTVHLLPIVFSDQGAIEVRYNTEGEEEPNIIKKWVSKENVANKEEGEKIFYSFNKEAGDPGLKYVEDVSSTGTKYIKIMNLKKYKNEHMLDLHPVAAGKVIYLNLPKYLLLLIIPIFSMLTLSYFLVKRMKIAPAGKKLYFTSYCVFCVVLFALLLNTPVSLVFEYFANFLIS